jgi:DNA sulfur modification protein DndC
LPKIFSEITGQHYHCDNVFLNNSPFGEDEWKILKDICGNNLLLFELQTTLLDIEQRALMLTVRKGILEELENSIRRCYYAGEDDAEMVQKAKVQFMQECLVKEGEMF